jgi:class 3 adenylate cyclase/predicted ATPase
MQQIADWLEKLGMSEYATLFAENGIDVTVLPHLTDQDLKEIGVLLGHRRKMLAAIGQLAGATTATPAPAARTESRPQDTAERRQVTVMFCDLVDSTGIAARLDAEEWRDLVGAYLHAASLAVTEMGGKIAKKLGDGLMALFGYPVAQENDAERAVRAALSILRALADLNRENAGTGKPALAARIAIDTGPVVVDAAGEIFGDVPNVAARAQGLAEPGSVVVTARVQRQIAGLFVIVERGSHELKGVPEPVTLYRIVRASGAGRRAGQRHLTPLVGRDDEIAMYNLLRQVADIGDAPLQGALEKLAEADILLVRGLPPASDYRFKHALIQEAAYENLLKSRRQTLHRRTAEVLRQQFADTAGAEPALLAHHFTQAGVTEAAIEWWRTAGQRALARSALLKGVEQLKRALTQIATLTATPDLRREEIRLEVAFANAMALSGDLVSGKEHYDRALAIYDPAEHGQLTTRSGRDIRVALLASRSACMWLLGYPAASRIDVGRAIKYARETGQPITLMFALQHSGSDNVFRGDYAAANASLGELVDLADESGVSYWKVIGTALLGWLFAATGKAPDAVRAITSGITSLRLAGATLYEPMHLQYLATAYAELGQLDDARRCIDDALDKVERSNERWCEAEVHRIAGEIVLKSPTPDLEKAKAYFDRALAVARAQQAKSWELRAVMSMVRLWRDRGRRDEARELLVSIYTWFSEGFDTLDLREARTLLNELES